LKEITLPIQLNALFLGGKTIEDELDEIEALANTGQVATLVIGDRVLGKFYIENAPATVSRFGGKGEYTVAETTLTFREYMERAV
jgi:phage protein U